MVSSGAGKPVKRSWPALVVAVSVGALWGGAVTQTLFTRERTALRSERDHWKHEAHHWAREWTKLQEEIGQANRRAEARTVVQSVKVVVLNSPVGQDLVRTAMDPLTSILLGMPLDGIKIQVAFGIFNGRVLIIQGRLYRVLVVGVLLSAESELLVRLVEIGAASRTGPRSTAGAGWHRSEGSAHGPSARIVSIRRIGRR